MTQLVVTAIGAAVGYVVSGFNPVGAYYGAVAASTAYGIYQANKQRIDGPRLSDFRMPGTDYGEPIVWFMGQQRMPGQIWWASQKREIRTTQRAGKGGGPKVNSYTYEIDVLIGINEEDGPGTRLVDVARIWHNGKLVRNRLTGADPETLAQVFREDVWRRLTVYTGHPTQMPDPTYEEAVGTAAAPAYRGRGTVFIQGLQLDGSGNMPVLHFEAITSAQSSIEAAALTDVEIARAVDFNAGTIGLNGDDVDEYLIAIGAWDGSYATTVVNVYAISLQATFVNSRFGGELVTPVRSAGTFNVASAAVTAGHGTADAPVLVQQESPTVVAVYSVPDGARVPYIVGEDFGSASLRFGLTGTTIVFGSAGFGAQRLRRFRTGNSAEVAHSAALPNFVNAIAIVGAYCYAAGKTAKVIYKLDLETMTLQATINRPSFGVGAAPDQWPMLCTINGQLLLVGNDTGSSGAHKAWTLNDDGSTWTQLSGTIAEALVQTSDQCQSIGVVGSLLVSGYNPQTESVYKTWTAPITLTTSPLQLQDVVEAINYRAFRDATKYDASALATVTTPVLSASMTAVEGVRGLLSQLQLAYPFECTVADKVYYKPRGGATAAVIPHDDLAVGIDEATRQPLPLTNSADLELPSEVVVRFFNASNDYMVGTERSDRLVLTTQRSSQVIELGLAMTPAQAKAIADRVMAEAAAALLTAKVTVGLAYAALEPGDSIEPTTRDGEPIRFRIGRRNDAGGVLSLDLVREDAALQTTDGETDEDYVDSTQVPGPSVTLWEALDIPLLRDTDDGPGWVVAEKGLTVTWPGGTLEVSANDVDFETEAEVDESAVMGFATSALGDFENGSAMFDHGNTVTVNVGFGELETSTREALLNDRTVNTAVLGSEIVRFIRAELLSTAPNVYRLSGLLRGQLGTEWALGEHAANERFVLLRVLGGLRNVLTEATEIGQLRYLKGVTRGGVVSGVRSEEFTDTGIKLKPYAPAALRAVPAASAGILCTWERRSRYAYRWPSVTPLPLGEATEAYEVDLFAPLLTVTWNVADKDADVALSGGDLVATIVSTGAEQGVVRGVQFRSATDARFFCGEYTGPDGRCCPGIAKATASLTQYPGQDASGYSVYGADGRLQFNGGSTAYTSAYGSGTIVGVGLAAGVLTFFTWSGSAWVSLGTAATGITGDWAPAWGPGSSAAGTRSFSLLDMEPPTGYARWGIGSNDVAVSTLQTAERSVELSAAASAGTLPVAAARLTLIGATYYGVDVEGNIASPTQLRRLVAQNAGGMLAASPYIGAVLIDAAYTATDAYTAAYFVTAIGSLISTTEVRRFSLADITTTAATYAAAPGDVLGIAHDGTDLWIIEAATPRLRRLDGAALTVSQTIALGGAVSGGLAHSGGVLFYVEDDDLVARDILGSPTILWRTALPAGYYATKDIVVAGGNVFVSAWFGVLVYDAATGALVVDTGVVAYSNGGELRTLTAFGSDVAIYAGPAAAEKFIVFDGATGAQAAAFNATAYGVLGADATRIWLAAQTSPLVVGVDLASGYEPLGGSLSGYTVRVYQISATVGRGYPAEVTIQ